MRMPLAQPRWSSGNSRTLRVAWLGLLAISHILARAPVAAEPSPSPHRYIPAKGLVAYLEYEGLDAHSGAWKASAAHGILVEGHAGSMMSELARQLLDRLFKDDPAWKNRGADILAIHDHLMHRGFVIAVHDMGKDGLATTVVLKDVGARPVRDRLGQLVKLALGPQGAQKLPAPLRFRGRDVFELDDEPEPKPGAKPDAPGPADVPVPQATAANVTPVPVSPSVAAVAPASYMAPFVAPAVASAPATSAPPAVAPSSPVSPISTTLLPPTAPPVPPGDRPPTNALATSDPTTVSWWFEGNDLVLIEAPAADPKSGAKPAVKKKPDAANNQYRSTVMDTIEGKEPDVTTNAAYISAIAENNDIKGFEPNGLLFFDPGKGKSLLSRLISLDETPAITLPSAKHISPADAPPELELSDFPAAELPELPDHPFAPEVDLGVKLAGNTAPVKVEDKELDLIGLLGMDGLKRIVVRWGFQDKALLTAVSIEAPAPRKGLIACLAQPSFARGRLPLIPRGTREFVVGSFDLFGSYTKFKDMVKAIDPDLVKEILEAERTVCEAIGLRGAGPLRQVGPSWSVFRLPSLDGNPPSTEPDLTEYAFVARTENAEEFGKMLDSIAQKVNQQLAEAEKGAGPDNDKDKKSADPPVLALEKLKGPDRGCQLTSPARLVPWLSDDLKPTILIGKSNVALASNLERAREALSAELPAGNSWSAHGELQKALECLPEDLTFLAVGDPRDSVWPTAFEQLPGEVQMLAGLFGFSEGEPSVGGGFLAALGIPRPGGFRVRIDPAQIPKAEQVRRNLFPSVLATTVNERGFRLISREAFPLACVGGKATFQSTGKWTGGKSFLQDVKLKLDLLGLGLGQ